MKQFAIMLSVGLILTGCATSKSPPPMGDHGPAAVWNQMKTRLAAGNIPGAVACFSVASKDDYQQRLISMSKTELNSFLKGLGPIKEASNDNEKAQYYFENVVGGTTITFPIEFDKENGEWKIVEF